MQAQGDPLGVGDAAGGVGDLVLGLLVLEREEAAGGVDGLSGGAAAQLAQGDGPDVREVVGAGGRDDGVPDHGRVGLVRGGGPVGGHVDEDLLGVPGEEGREVGVERELDDGVFFFLGAVVVRPAFYAVWGVGLVYKKE